MMPLLTVLAFGLTTMTGTLNSALAPTAGQLRQVWQTGYAQADRNRDMKGALKFAQRGIGSINNKTVNWLTFEHPRLVAYRSGFNARKQQWSDAEVQRSQEELADVADGRLRRATFHGEVNLYPSIQVGRIARQANPDDLRDIRVVLKVGDRTYQPVSQPRDVRAQRHEGLQRSERYVPLTQDRHGRRVHEQITIPVETRYSWYKGEFDVAFELFDSDGAPRITEKDREFTILVISRTGDRRATFRLDDWRNAYE